METVRLTQAVPGEVRLVVTNEVVRIVSAIETEQVRVTGVAATGPRGPRGLVGPVSPDAVVAVFHGDDPDYPRPEGPQVAFWFGTVIPNNTDEYDHVFVPDTVIV